MGTSLGWQCTVCTYQHQAPGTRCVMCGELRVSKNDMSNFILGKPIPTEHTTNSSTTTLTANPPAKESTSLASKKPAIVSASQKTPFSLAAGSTSKTGRVPPSIGNRTLPYEPGPVPYDHEAAKTWIYPSSDVYEKRKYQFEITETAVHQNTLVSLPTGLGKTLIAAVVLYNYYRWFPKGKVLFLAPTVPLVAQQVSACYEIMGIPEDHTAVLTGKIAAKERIGIYKTKRVFFCTPQTIQKDLENDRIDDPQSIVCVVLDEAHKAVGDYAYCKVVEQLETAKAKFRLLGLSATPGTSIKAIQQVIYKLRINCIEARTDTDVQQYIHDRHSEEVIVKEVSAVRNIQRLLDEILQPILDHLRKSNAIRMVGNATVTPYCLIKARETYEGRQDYQPSNVGYFVAAISLVQLRSDLHRHGLGVVRNKLLNYKNNRPRGVMANVVRSAKFDELCNEVEKASSTADASGKQVHDRLKNNPKLEKLQEILTEHFERCKACNTLDATRAIVFSQFRDSVYEIEAALQDLNLIRPRHFVGQKGADKMRGMNQEEQKRVIQEFRDGKHNVLVCTCIGEEGLDIGEVDLIVNFDCLSSPIRMIQRVGRTGRKRNGQFKDLNCTRQSHFCHTIGKVVTLVSEGAEQRTLKKSKQNERNLVHALRSPRSFTVTPSAPTFPQPPQLEERDMRISNSFRMSQVDGAKKVNRKLSSRDVSSMSRQKWKLCIKDERLVEKALGPWKTLQIENNRYGSSTLWPRQLRKRLLLGRTKSVGAKKRPSLFSFGPFALMLQRFQSGFTLNEMQHGNKGGVLEQLFPLDARPVEPKLHNERMSCEDAPSFATVNTAQHLDILAEGSKIDAEEQPNPISSSRGISNPYRKFEKQPNLTNSASGLKNPSSTNEISCSETMELKAENLYIKDKNAASRENRKRRNPYAEECGRVEQTEKLMCKGMSNSANFHCDLPVDEFELPSQDDSSGHSQDESRRGNFDEFRLPSQDSSEADGGSKEEHELPAPVEAIRIQNICVLKQDATGEGGFVLPTQESSIEDRSFERIQGNTDNLMSSATADKGIRHGQATKPGLKMPSSNSLNTSCQYESQQTQEHVHTRRRKVLAIEDSPDSAASFSKGHGECMMNAREVHLRGTSSAPKPLSVEVMLDTPGSQEASRKKRHSASVLEDTPDNHVDMKNTLCAQKRSKHNNSDPNRIVCAVCFSGRVLDDDPLVLCDGHKRKCGLAVHVDCYSAHISVTDKRWYCDLCAFRREGKETETIRCAFCKVSEGTKRLLEIDSWACIPCFSGTKGTTKSRSSHIQLDNYHLTIGESTDERDVKRRREQVMKKYVSNEADVASDASQDEDSDILEAIEAEEAGNAFIDDSSQLGYTQDDIDSSEYEIEFGNKSHLAFDAMRERARRFGTPLMNRRMRSSRQTFSASQGSERSDRGLGSMHFIRSVLEHHRQGGTSAEIEAVFQELEAGNIDNDE